MKKVFFLLTMLYWFINVAISQVTYTSDKFATATDTFLLSSVPKEQLMVFDFSETGENHTWNYSNLPIYTQNVQQYINPNNTPYSSIFYPICLFTGKGDLFSCATMWGKLTNLGVQGLSSFSLSDMAINDFTQLLNLKNNALEMTMAGVTVEQNGSALPLVIIFDSPDRIYKFPLSYGLRDSSQSKFVVDANTLGVDMVYKKNTKRTVIVEGWGKLTTPYKHFDNVLKLKTILVNKDTLISKGQTSPVALSSIVIYSWFSLDWGYPVLEATGSIIAGNEIISSVRFIDQQRCLPPNAWFAAYPFSPKLDPQAGTAIVNFNNLSINQTSNYWDFGDQASGALNNSTLKNAEHTYSHDGKYEVKLLITNNICSPALTDSMKYQLVVSTDGQVNVTSMYEQEDDLIEVYPMPSVGNINFKLNFESASNIIIQLYDYKGSMVYESLIGNKQADYSISGDFLQAGIYLLCLTVDNKKYTKKIVVGSK